MVLTAFLFLLTELSGLPGLTPHTNPPSVDEEAGFETLVCSPIRLWTQKLGIGTHRIDPLNVDGGTSFGTQDDGRDKSALPSTELTSTPRFTDPLSVDGGADFETLDRFSLRGTRKFGTGTYRIDLIRTFHGSPQRGRRDRIRSTGLLTHQRLRA